MAPRAKKLPAKDMKHSGVNMATGNNRLHLPALTYISERLHLKSKYGTRIQKYADKASWTDLALQVDHPYRICVGSVEPCWGHRILQARVVPCTDLTAVVIRLGFGSGSLGHR